MREGAEFRELMLQIVRTPYGFSPVYATDIEKK